MRIKTNRSELPNYGGMEWQPITTAPYELDLELAVLDAEGIHTLVFPCRRIPAGWLKSSTNQWVEVHPTHWREWTAQSPRSFG
jgi:hypothetical protein